MIIHKEGVVCLHACPNSPNTNEKTNDKTGIGSECSMVNTAMSFEVVAVIYSQFTQQQLAVTQFMRWVLFACPPLIIF